MDATLKRRWYQFSLRTLLLAMLVLSIGFGSYIAWQRHRHFCITQCYRFMDDVGEDGGYSMSLYYSDEPYTLEEGRELNIVNEHREQISKAYCWAIYRPWERLWIGPEPRPPKRPERFAERIKSCRDSASRDAQLRALASPGKRPPPPDYYPRDPVSVDNFQDLQPTAP